MLHNLVGKGTLGSLSISGLYREYSLALLAAASCDVNTSEAAKWFSTQYSQLRSAPWGTRPPVKYALGVTPEQLQQYSTAAAAAAKPNKPKVVILGSGWSSMTFVKRLSLEASKKYDITVISPRNYFLYTPLLPAVASGTCEERSIVEPVRKLIHGKGVYYEAAATEIDVNKKVVKAAPVKGGAPNVSTHTFSQPYDVLVTGVGSVNTTFGIPGVQENCMFFKSIEDANKLRQRVSECFEEANLPERSEEEAQKLLTFVVVGGGPTGVEVAAELYDICHEDLHRLYPALVPKVRLMVVEMLPKVLAMYSPEVSTYTENQFRRAGIQLLTSHRVNQVEKDVVVVENKEKQAQRVPFGACVWATGVAKNPLIKQLQDAIPESGKHFRAIQVDPWLRVMGGKGAVWAMGDAALITRQRAQDFADQLFTQADINKDGKLQLKELQTILVEAAKQYSHLEEHAQFLAKKPAIATPSAAPLSRMIKKVFSSANVASKSAPSAVLGDLTESSELTPQEFKDLLARMDQRISPLPPTAQVAWQQGEYLASLFAKHTITGQEGALPANAAEFEYQHRGSAAYVGSDRAVFDTVSWGPVTGVHAGWAWKGFETMQQISFRNRLHVAWDWLRTKVFGRDISRIRY